MSAIENESQRMSLLFQYGVVDAHDVIAWVDSLIEQIDSPPDLLLDLSSTAPDNTGDILARLRRLSAGSEFWESFRSSIPQIRDYTAAHHDRAESIANHLVLTLISFQDEAPDDLHFLYWFDDAFSLAREGICGSPESVCHAFIQELDEWIADRPR